ncbi:MAG: YkgJ family cysteine cluster protein, partial [Methanolinea sp.]|nr:YkgJ family cysteine cluster protein [Methanolinea sp.]
MHPLLPEPFSRHIASRRQEMEALSHYPLEQLAAIIEEVGFLCDLCGKCCTRAFNGHVLLLEEDAERVRSIDPESLEPP